MTTATRSNIGDNAAKAYANRKIIPTLTEISDRFIDLDAKFLIYIRSMGYIPELRRNGRSRCVVDVKTCINMLNRGVAIDVIDDGDLRRLRNSLIYYNEYFCKSEENAEGSYKPALTAELYIEEKYRRKFNIIELDYNKGNPFATDILKGFGCLADRPTFEEQKRKYGGGDVKMSIKTATQKPIKKEETRLVTIHEKISEQIKDPIDFNNWDEWCDDLELF